MHRPSRDPLFNRCGANGSAEPESLSDEAIVERVKSGDLSSFELIMRRYNQRMFRIARSILGEDNEAEDVVQEAYLRAYQNLSQFAGSARFSTWLTKIAVYAASARRRKLRRMQLFDPTDWERIPMSPDSSTPDAAARPCMNELGVVLADAVDELPADLRAVFTLRIVEGLGTTETAECLSLSTSNVKTRLHRARGLLRNQIDKRIGEEARRLYQFDGERCDRIVDNVLRRLQHPDNDATLH